MYKRLTSGVCLIAALFYQFFLFSCLRRPNVYARTVPDVVFVSSVPQLPFPLTTFIFGYLQV